MSALRPLPPRPSLEFERKEAKAHRRRLRAGDPNALARARARHPAIDASAPARIRLADAQLVIAREYGFASWPRLVRYFGDVERQRFSHRSIFERDFYDGNVRALLAEHRDRRRWVGHALASYVPRFYGMRVDDVFEATVTEDEARLAIARQSGFPSWEVLLERTTSEARRHPADWDVQPIHDASKAMEAADLGELRRIVEAHPELLHPSADDLAAGRSLIGSAVHHERVHGQAAMRPIIDWLVSQGFDLQRELNRQLCGHMRMKTEKVRWLLDRGADPNWMAPNDIPVLEHALIRYWNDEAVDLVAARAAPRKALWIAAGLGDVDGVARFLDARGKPTPAARRLRPDYDAVGPVGMPSHPDPDDEEILFEAFVVAMLNGRTAVLEYMVSRGFPVNTLLWDSPVINFAVGNAMTALVKCLVRCGADLDLRGWRPHMSAREIARELFEQNPQNADRRRILELCGLDPAIVLAERDARPIDPPRLLPKLSEGLELAGDDAFRLGHSAICPENLVVGLLRSGHPLFSFSMPSRAELERFRTDMRDRLRPAEDRVERPELPLNPDAQAAMQEAIAAATERRSDVVTGFHLLYALTRAGHGAVADLLARYGSSAAVLNAELERALR